MSWFRLVDSSVSCRHLRPRSFWEIDNCVVEGTFGHSRSGSKGCGQGTFSFCPFPLGTPRVPTYVWQQRALGSTLEEAKGLRVPLKSVLCDIVDLPGLDARRSRWVEAMATRKQDPVLQARMTKTRDDGLG